MKLTRLIPICLTFGAIAAWAGRGGITEEDRKWWAFQPVADPAIPVISDKAWTQNPIDHFIFEKLASQGLKPAPEASREDLIRRVTLDLWGMPPSPEESAAFINDTSPEAYDKLINRLLESPHYGEHWARHWLDLVRYADSDGYKADDFRPDAWRYRDYVIRSLNADKPYTQFISEQLAGDEISPNDPDALIATGYLRHWIYEYNNRDVAGQRTTILNDITDTTADVFLGLGLQCARCHDHKFDPLLQKDYFRLQAVFAPIVPSEKTIIATKEQRDAYQAKLLAWQEATADIRRQISEIEDKYKGPAENDAVKRFPDETQAILKKPEAERTPYEKQIWHIAYQQVVYEFDHLEAKIKGTDKERMNELRKQLAKFDNIKPAPLPAAPTVTDGAPKAPEVLIPKRESMGDILPGIPTILNEAPLAVKPLEQSTGRRSAFAQWLAEPTNPLTARVMVNRLWHWHFGRGLSTTTSDFGKLGTAPSHPELLDWLSHQFVSSNWSLKKLHKLMVSSSAYRQSAQSLDFDRGKLEDPENRLLWRWNTRRLDAEQIRDSLLSATGELDLTAGGPPVDFTKPRRTIYNKVLRNVRDPLLDVFDSPQHFNSTATRDTTTTAVQSLLLINSRQLIESSQTMSRRLVKEKPGNESEQIRLAYQLLFNRQPATDELSDALTFLQSQEATTPKVKEIEQPFLAESMPQREGKAAVLAPGSAQERLVMNTPMPKLEADFTIESVVLLRSVYDSGEVRVIASSWNGEKQKTGWALGITGARSARKPQMPVLQMVGNGADGALLYEPLFSDLQIQLERSYYLAASIHLGGPGEGSVTFFLKDLSNDDELLQTTVVPHPIARDVAGESPLVIGGRAEKRAASQWDGLIDEVRLSKGLITAEQCFYQQKNKTLPSSVMASWQFEPETGFLNDTAQKVVNLTTVTPKNASASENNALADFCHALLNSNEFLYLR